MDKTGQASDQLIKELFNVINDQQKREDELIEMIKELLDENAKLKRKKVFGFKNKRNLLVYTGVHQQPRKEPHTLSQWKRTK